MSNKTVADSLKPKNGMLKDYAFYGHQPDIQKYCFYNEQDWKTAFIIVTKQGNKTLLHSGLPWQHGVAEEAGWRLWKEEVR
jgi:hypothetical protein